VEEQVEEVKCSRCDRKWLTIYDFNLDKKSATGRRRECKECQRREAREYRKAYYQKNKEKIKKQQKAKYEPK